MPSPERTARDQRRRTLGQNFLEDERLVAELVEQAQVRPQDLVLEIGPGKGIITRQLARRAGEVLALEKDPVWAARLAARFRDDPRVVVRHGDILTTPLPTAPFRVFSNIPFGLTTAILRRLLDNPDTSLQRADLIVQWEVAKKHAATRHRSLVTASWLPWFEFTLGRRLPASLFRPVPRVDAGLLTIRRRPVALLPSADRDRFVRLLTLGYTGKGGSLGAAVAPQLLPSRFRAAAREAGISREATAPELTVEQWVALYRAMRSP
jgi:23S rRNA (adenine-N6)-dimethyltransferase